MNEDLNHNDYYDSDSGNPLIPASFELGATQFEMALQQVSARIV